MLCSNSPAQLEQALQGIRYLHQNGIVHECIRPSAILISDEGRAVISNFARRQLVVGLDPAHGVTDDLDDTRYSSPKLMAGRESPASDLHSWAMTALEIVSAGEPVSSDYSG